MSVARLRLQNRPLLPGMVAILGETSQAPTVDAAWLVDTVAATPGSRLWCVADPHQAKAVRAGGLAVRVRVASLDVDDPVE